MDQAVDEFFYDIPAQEELGDVLFSLVNLSRHLKVNAALALEKANHKFRLRFELMQEMCLKDNVKVESLSLKEMDIYCAKSKKVLFKDKIVKNQSEAKN